MRFDVFFSICQTEVDGYTPSERVMFENFFDQVKLADTLNFETAWIAETHLSCEIQKQSPNAVIPHFKGEIGLNTDILQMAHKVFAMTKKIEVGSAIRNILCNGGPLAHAEAIKTFLTLHGMNPAETRKIHIGFASGRFDFSNRPYGIVPRSKVEEAAWPVVKGKILTEATQIFLKALKGEIFSSQDLPPQYLERADFRNDSDWEKVRAAAETEADMISLPPRYTFEKVGVIPFDAPLGLLNLTIGTHDPKLQVLANKILPVGVFNLSITPPKVIEETHERMRANYHPSGGHWTRAHMPRTAMIFLNDDPGLSREEKRAKAKQVAQRAWENYWRAMEGTLDSAKVEQAVENALVGSPEDLVEQIRAKYDKEDRLMLWFDFNNHDNEEIKKNMISFAEKVMPALNSKGGRPNG